MFITIYFFHRSAQNNMTTEQTYIALRYASYVRSIQAEFTTSIFQMCQWSVQNDKTFPCTNVQETYEYWDGNKSEISLLGCYAAYTCSYWPMFRDTLSEPSSRASGLDPRRWYQ